MGAYLQYIFSQTALRYLTIDPGQEISVQANVTFTVTPGWQAPVPNSPVVWQAAMQLTYNGHDAFNGSSGASSVALLSNSVQITNPNINGSFVPISGKVPSIIFGVLDSTLVTISICAENVEAPE
jgi:hypothetical protein